MLTSGTSDKMSLYFLSFEVSYYQSGSRRRSAPEASSLSTALIMWSWVCIIFALPKKSQSNKWPSSATNRFSGCSVTPPRPAHLLYFAPRLAQKYRLRMEVRQVRITEDCEFAHNYNLNYLTFDSDFSTLSNVTKYHSYHNIETPDSPYTLSIKFEYNPWSSVSMNQINTQIISIAKWGLGCGWSPRPGAK